MDESSAGLHAALEASKKIQEELDTKIFQFRTLYETSQELNGLIQPRKIMETFLLMTMGSLGIAQGWAALTTSRSVEAVGINRGFTEDEARLCAQSLPLISERYFPQKDALEPFFPKVWIVREDLDRTLLPLPASLLVLWILNEEYHGLLVLGEKISCQAYGDGDLDTLLNLTNILMGSLSRALSTRSIQQLNADLQKQNDALQTALEDARKAREELDRHVFHLKTISDLNSELSPIMRTDALLENFLLVTMGALGVSQGLCILCDRETKTVRAALRGIEWAGSLSYEASERLLFQAFNGSQARSLAPLTATRIHNPAPMFSEAGLPVDTRCGILFVLDHRCLGVIGYGSTISGAPLSEEEEELLLTHTAGFMVFLKNAGSFETIEALNEDLAHRNEELRKTIAELTEAKHTIAILERARIHIQALVQREMERIGRVSWLDLVVICVMAAILAALFNLANPQGLRLLPEALLKPPSPVIETVEARALLTSGDAVIVDARPKELYGQKHIIGAVNVPIGLFDMIYMMKLSKLDPKKEIIVYGRTVSKLYDEELAYRLRQRDHEKVRVLSGGLGAWESRGYEVE